MLRSLLALVLVVAGLWCLEAARSGVAITRADVGATPVTRYARPGADGPVVVIAHGFAGSRQMMAGYALPLARAGYRVHAFDFLGHGRNPVPMSGDVTAQDGATRRLVVQTETVIDAVAEGTPVALLGHSMATDVLARVAAARDDIGPVVLVSAYSGAIDATTPRDLLIIAGAWEPGLRGFAREALRMVDPAADEGDTARAGTVIRRAVAAPFSEHVAVLQSRVGRAEAVGWLDRAYGRTHPVTIPPTGWAILAVLGGLVAGIVPLARRLPARAAPPLPLGRGRLAAVTLVPAIAAPAGAVLLDVSALPVLVADHLAVHLGLFGALQLALLWRWGARPGGLSLAGLGLLLAWSVLFGVALDRYAANFWPVAERLPIIAALAAGALPFMLADAVLTHGAPLGRRIALRGAFLVSLGLAVALAPRELFFLVMIAPVILLFYAVFGTAGRAVSARTGPLAPGIALGLVLAWALGVSFPLFAA
ncbi:alpha/beta fold hydrolase [Roseivivax isoporae]|uniref:alpha/beta fold hydrolase n=1 Tax=Roseivivax isoporae TaxID=591206 RepID=UPI0004B469A0|nr:alpha/beta fold hydrolase [Roseivivax isoporae]